LPCGEPRRGGKVLSRIDAGLDEFAIVAARFLRLAPLLVDRLCYCARVYRQDIAGLLPGFLDGFGFRRGFGVKPGVS